MPLRRPANVVRNDEDLTRVVGMEVGIRAHILKSIEDIGAVDFLMGNR